MIEEENGFPLYLLSVHLQLFTTDLPVTANQDGIIKVVVFKLNSVCLSCSWDGLAFFRVSGMML